jgi:hypothetical protein
MNKNGNKAPINTPCKAILESDVVIKLLKNPMTAEIKTSGMF